MARILSALPPSSRCHPEPASPHPTSVVSSRAKRFSAQPRDLLLLSPQSATLLCCVIPSPQSATHLCCVIPSEALFSGAEGPAFAEPAERYPPLLCHPKPASPHPTSVVSSRAKRFSAEPRDLLLGKRPQHEPIPLTPQKRAAPCRPEPPRKRCTANSPLPRAPSFPRFLRKGWEAMQPHSPHRPARLPAPWPMRSGRSTNSSDRCATPASNNESCCTRCRRTSTSRPGSMGLWSATTTRPGRRRSGRKAEAGDSGGAPQRALTYGPNGSASVTAAGIVLIKYFSARNILWAVSLSAAPR